MDKPLKAAVIGVGFLGRHHARIYHEMPGVELAGVVDIDRKAASDLAGQYNTTPYTDHHQVLGITDLVSIAVPTVDHFQVARDFLEAGADILLEKPITAELTEARELNNLARKSGRILQVGHLEHFNPAVVALKKYAHAPRFIEAHRMGPFVGRGTDVDVIRDLMIHDIDIICSLVGSPVERVSAVGVPVVSEHIDIANCRLEFANGCVANINSSRVSLKKMRKIRLFQPDIYLSLDYAKKNLTRVSINDKQKSIVPGIPFGFTRKKTKIDTAREPLKAQLESFVACARDRNRPVVSGEEGIRALDIAIRIKEEINLNLNKGVTDGPLARIIRES
ncbi:MAG: Gfo/Idh/MocA family oxidoreductase [bacterium]